MTRLTPVAVAVAAAVLVPGHADAARFAVGLRDAASLDRAAARLAARGIPVSRELQPLGVLVVHARSPGRLPDLAGVDYVERVDAQRRLAFVPSDPLASRQWYLTQIRAFDFWPELPSLPGVKVAVIDSGIDATHPELAQRIATARSFVGGSPLTDEQGHGTFLAGEIGADLNNGEGIAGIGFTSQLVIGKIVRADRTISLDAEAAAIRWAVDSGARVINLSLGGLRDPRNRRRDTYSRLEAAAVEYAYSRGAVLVAAVGNSDQAPIQPWPFASYPAALPHVLGVTAIGQDGSVPGFSNRDRIFNDLAAPGQDIFSTLPRALTQARPACPEQGYSSCGPEEYRRGEGTSFAAPQASAAAALLFSVNPKLRPDQVTTLLEHSAADVNPGTGCRRCSPRRDSLSGWGRLDVAGAIAAAGGSLPVADRFETNDDAGSRAHRLWGSGPRRLVATIDFWDDQVDVYAIRLAAGQRLTATVRGPGRANTNLVLWRPGTETVESVSLKALRFRAAQSARPGAKEQIVYRAPRTGWYYLEVKIATPGYGPYTLSYVKR